ncbi:FAD-dependent oxidoreductase [Tautonia plasticadhaerens]|uniref:Protoporphyrinogen oxidase n=1 Tax=Tautonia plasticadhaerens TaxID=2527974 RepID=A0A518HFN1_9BACT|nr:FAD-dependent oxidoreductase [Tautonia plasticadhaerens]QDV39645.1 Protoporphyrinogen oxidase [Tautonia plasticadhaerens]
MRVAVIGAGPAGLAAAYRLAGSGEDVEVFESSGQVGGMARSFRLWGQTVDLGPHRFFSTDPRVNALWMEVAGRDYRMVDRLTRIYYGGRYYRYPLEPADALRKMGVVEASRCMLSYLKEQVNPSFPEGSGGTFESWVVGRFGRRLFEMFFRSYSEKLWGIPCSDLDEDFAAQRIKKFSLGEAAKKAIGLGGAGHKTLVDRFAYPLGGTGMIYERMADAVREAGGRVHLGARVRRVLHQEGSVRGLELADGDRVGFDHVISTMPLTLLVRGLGEAPEAVSRAVDSLRFRNTVLVYLNVEGTDLFPDQWLYIHSPELMAGRLTNFRNWVPELHGGAGSSILALEYWCDDEDPLWAEHEEAQVARAVRELRATGLIGDARILDGDVVRVPRCYPVYRMGYKDHLSAVTSYLSGFSGLTPIGRYGSFKYNNQDHSLLMGILAAENLRSGTRHDLWSINTDYECYQEAAEIRETRLGGVEADPVPIPAPSPA